MFVSFSQVDFLHYQTNQTVNALPHILFLSRLNANDKMCILPFKQGIKDLVGKRKKADYPFFSLISSQCFLQSFSLRSLKVRIVC